jgi:hypothetical protein
MHEKELEKGMWVDTGACMPFFVDLCDLTIDQSIQSLKSAL